MKPAAKVFSILSLSAAVGKKIMLLNESKELFCAGKCLHDIGHETTGKYPYAPLSFNVVACVMNAVVSLLSSPIKPPELVSILIAGLTDIRSKSKHKELLDPVIEVAQYCVDLYPDVDHDVAFDLYMEWCK